MSYNDDWARDFDRRAHEQLEEAERAACERRMTHELASRRVHNSAAAIASEQRRHIDRGKWWLVAAFVCFVIGMLCVIIGAEQNSPDHIDQTPGAPALIIGGILIGLCLVISVITLLTMLIGVNYAAHPGTRKGAPNPAPWIFTFCGCLAMVLIGATIIVTQSGQGGAAGKSATNLGIALIIPGLMGGAVWIVLGVMHIFRPQRLAYKRWMASLTPHERAVVYGLQAAGLLGLHEVMKHGNKERAERHARQVWNNARDPQN